MSTDNTEVIERPETVTPAVEATPAPAEAPERSETETRARAMGWVDKADYRGPAENWRDADEFVRRGEEELPIVRERNRDLARKNAEIEARISRQEREFAERAAKLERMSTIALSRQREQLEANYEAAKRQAVEIGDTGRYDQLSRDHGQAVRQFDQQYYEATAPPKQTGQELPPHVTAEVGAWTQQNPWFNADPLLNQYAQAVHMQINQAKPGLSIRDNLAEVAREVRQRFPEKFSVAERRATAVESGGGGLPSGGKRAKGVSELPAEARSVGNEFVKAGAFKSLAEYAKDYWAQDGA